MYPSSCKSYISSSKTVCVEVHTDTWIPYVLLLNTHLPVLLAQKPKWSPSALLWGLSQINSWQREELVLVLPCFPTGLTITSRLLGSSIYSKKSILLKPVVGGGVFSFFFPSKVLHYISIFNITAAGGTMVNARVLMCMWKGESVSYLLKSNLR